MASIPPPQNQDHQDVWLARRKDTGQYATVGGFVMLGESVEQAVFRELQEETGFTQADIDASRDQKRAKIQTPSSYTQWFMEKVVLIEVLYSLLESRGMRVESIQYGSWSIMTTILRVAVLLKLHLWAIDGQSRR